MEDYINKTIELLDIEKESEVNETISNFNTLTSKELESKGITIRKLKLVSISTGLGGRSLLKFESATNTNTSGGKKQELVSHKLSPGDIVGIRYSKSKPGSSSLVNHAIVYRVDNVKIIISLEQSDQDTDNTLLKFTEDNSNNNIFSIDKLANDVTYKKIKDSLLKLKSNYLNTNATGTHYVNDSKRIINVIFNGVDPTNIKSNWKEEKLKLISSKLNESQIEAIQFSLNMSEISCIHGPPGTGKTTTVVEFILQAVKQGKKVLACGPSNLSVDNILEKLIKHSDVVKPTRIGHPTRILSSLFKYTLDHKTKNSEQGKLIKDIRNEIKQLLEKSKSNSGKESKYKIYQEVKNLRNDLKSREKLMMDEVLSNSNVILATNTGASDFSLKSRNDFDWVIIDECAQALEASCWIPILKGNRVLLAGDHKQLPPTIHSQEAANKGLSTTLFERVINKFGDQVSRLLSIQYRMNKLIMDWSSNEFYGGHLSADSSVANHLLSDNELVHKSLSTTSPLLLIDTADCELEENEDKETESKFNEGEAKIVDRHIEKLIKSGIDQKDIGVITPYNGQVKLLKSTVQKKFPLIEVGTVDGFQGREKDVIVISMVRSNPPPHKIGFLSEDRRTNVAITRARKHVAIICDSETISIHPPLKRMIDYFTKFGIIRSSLEYLDDDWILSDEEIFNPNNNNNDEYIKIHNNSSSNSTNKSKVRKSKAELLKEKKAKKRDEKDKETEKEEIKLKYNEKFNLFLKSKEISHSFPSSLNAFERLIVHQLAEELNLNHQSEGDANNRVITIKKIDPEIKITSTTTTTNNSISNNNNIKIDKLEKEEEIKDEEEEDDDEEEDKTTTIDNNKNNSNKSKKKKKSKPTNSTNKPNASIKKPTAKPKQKNADELLKEFESLEIPDINLKICGFKGCGKGVEILGRVCQFCSRKFCTQHALYEIHGCGERAKFKARDDWFKQNSSKKSNTVAKEKLGELVSESQNSRKKKQSSNTK